MLGIVDFLHYHELDYKLTYIFQRTSLTAHLLDEM